MAWGEYQGPDRKVQRAAFDPRSKVPLPCFNKCRFWKIKKQNIFRQDGDKESKLLKAYKQIFKYLRSRKSSREVLRLLESRTEKGILKKGKEFTEQLNEFLASALTAEGVRKRFISEQSPTPCPWEGACRTMSNRCGKW